MKTNIIIILLLITSIKIFSQSAESYKNTNDTIVKNDGTEIIGDFYSIAIGKKNITILKISDNYPKNKKLGRNDFEKIKIPSNTVNKIIDHAFVMVHNEDITEDNVISEELSISYKDYKTTYERILYKKVVLPNKKQRFLSTLVEGYCDLYRDETIASDNNGRSRTHYHYYAKYNDEEKSTLLKAYGYSVGSGSKNKIKKYFKDCLIAQEFIENQDKINGKQIIKVVKLYNENCTH